MATFYREIILSGDRFDTLRFGSLIVDWVQQQISVDKQSPASKVILLMEEILHQMIGSLSPYTYLQGFTHPRWCRISSINRKEKPSVQTATTVATKAILSWGRWIPYGHKWPGMTLKTLHLYCVLPGEVQRMNTHDKALEKVVLCKYMTIGWEYKLNIRRVVGVFFCGGEWTFEDAQVLESSIPWNKNNHSSSK